MKWLHTEFLLKKKWTHHFNQERNHMKNINIKSNMTRISGQIKHEEVIKICHRATLFLGNFADKFTLCTTKNERYQVYESMKIDSLHHFASEIADFYISGKDKEAQISASALELVSLHYKQNTAHKFMVARPFWNKEEECWYVDNLITSEVPV